MADYSHHHTYRVARAPRSNSARRFGWLLAAGASLMLAVLAWVWTQQRTVESPLPKTVAAAPASVSAPAKPAPVAMAAGPAPSPAIMPPSDVVAASGDTRAVH